MKNSFIDRHFRLVLALVCVLGAAAYALLCQGRLVWMDEAYTFGMIRRSYSDMCAVTALDVHPPLFYILLKAFSTPFADKLLAGKLFSVIPYVIIMIFGGVQFKKLFDAKTGVWFAVLFFFFPFMMTYAAEVRMYSVSALFVLINAVYAYRIYLDGKRADWVIFTLSGLCAAYTHYFALASAGIIYIMLFLAAVTKKRELIKPFFVAAAVTVIAYLPWLRFFLVQLKYKIDNEYWIDPITLKTLKSYFFEIFGDGASAFAVLGAFCVMIAAAFKSGRGKVVLLGIGVPFLTLAVGLIASFIIRPVFVIRYLLPSVPLLIAAAAVGMGCINKRIIGIILIAAVAVVGAVNYGVVYADKNTHFENRMDDAFYQRNSDCDAYIVTIDVPVSPGHTETVLAYYEKEKEIYQVIENYGYYPFENFRYIEDFDPDKHDRVILFVAQGKEIPEEYRQIYNCEYRESTTSLWIMTDVYLLTKKD